MPAGHLDPALRRLAVPAEDHSLEAGDFEVVHQGQARGSGAVIIWDEGRAQSLRDEPGHLSVRLQGSKLAGGFALTRTGHRRWILVKVRDEHAHPARISSPSIEPASAAAGPGRTWPMPGIRTRPDELGPTYGALPMLAHGGASSPRVRHPSLRHPHGRPACAGRPGTTPLSRVSRRSRARTGPDDRSNVASAVISEVLPTF